MASLASQNYTGAVSGAISTGVEAVNGLVRNAGFIGSEFDKMKKWDETHNKDGSLKK